MPESFSMGGGNKPNSETKSSLKGGKGVANRISQRKKKKTASPPASEKEETDLGKEQRKRCPLANPR